MIVWALRGLSGLFCSPSLGKIDIEGDHHFRDRALGFFDSPPARRDLLKYLKQQVNDKPIALDAQNLGGLNKAVGRDAAEKIWGIYTKAYLDVLQKEFPDADTLCGFKDAGDEAQIVIRGHQITKQNLENALWKAKAEVESVFKPYGIQNVPHLDPNQPSGFGLHTEVVGLFAPIIDKDKILRIEQERERWRNYGEPELADIGYDKAIIPELIIAKTNLNKNKCKHTDGSWPETMMDEEFEAVYRDKIISFASTQKPIQPTFRLPANFELTESMEGGQRDKYEKRRDFLKDVPEDSVLLQFDFAGMKILNKHLYSDEVDEIIARMRETVEHHFKISSSIIPYGYLSCNAGSGVIDVVVPKESMYTINEDSFKHINFSLDNLLKLYLLGESAYRNSSVKPRYPDVYATMPKEITCVAVPVIDGDPDATLRAAGAAMDETKKERDAFKQRISYPSACLV